MANYKLPWNYEPGINSVNIFLDFGTNTGNPILTNYHSKYSDYYLYNSSSDSMVFSQYTWSVSVTKANNPNITVNLTEAEQLEVTSVENNKYKVTYPGISKTLDYTVYVAKPSSYYQLVKKTLVNSSSWVNTNSWSNDTLSNYHYQCPKYFVPINTNINLNEEFKLRWIGYSTTINGLSYSLPSTYYVDNTIDNFSYTTITFLPIYDTNPKVTYHGDNVVPLSRSNGNWIMNIPNTGTYTLNAYYTRNSKTLKPTMEEDIGLGLNVDKFAWNTTIEAYDPSIAKVLSTDLYTYRQQGYDWVSYKGTWVATDTEGALSDLSFEDQKYAYIPFRNDATCQTVGIDLYSQRGSSYQRTVKIHGTIKNGTTYGWLYPTRYCFTNENIEGSTDSSLGFPLTPGTNATIDIEIPLTSSDYWGSRSINVYFWSVNKWYNCCDISIDFDRLTLDANLGSADGVPRAYFSPYFSTDLQVQYY